MKIIGHAILGESGKVVVHVQSDSQPSLDYECHPKDLKKLGIALTRMAEMAEITQLRVGQKAVKLWVTV